MGQGTSNYQLHYRTWHDDSDEHFALKAAEDRARLQRLLPDESTLDKISRYEAHLSRQLVQALHELERLKAARGGADITPPAALDVNVNGASPALEMALENTSRT